MTVAARRMAARTTAIVVGVEQYQAGERWRLNGPALDACRFARWLTSRGVPTERITVLVSPLPENARDVMERLQGYEVRAADHATVSEIFTRRLPGQTSDLLIVYWGGHGVVEHDERRLIYADATALDKKNLNFSSLLKSMRSRNFAGHPRQLGYVDACMNIATQLGWEGTMPDERFGAGPAEAERDQRVLLAASRGELAVNLDALQTGLFSSVLQDELDALPADVWPPDADRLRDRVRERFQRLRENRHTQQVPSGIWYLSRSDEDSQIFRPETAGERTDSAAVGSLLLTFAQYHKLTAILDGARAPSRLSELYREATRDVVGVRPPRQPSDLMSTIDALRRPVSGLPLFKFLVHFAASSDAVTQDKLWKWIERVAPSWGVDIDELTALKMELGRSFLLLKLVPDLLGGGVLLTGWTYQGEDGRKCLAPDGPCGRARLSADVSRLLQDVDPESDPVMPVIEFLVPLAMLDDDFDELTVRIHGQDRKLGSTFPVVVRPLDRPADREARKSWQESWDELLARYSAYDEDAICWVEHCKAGQPFDPVALRTRICAALAYARSWGPHEDPALRAALAAGIPVALWHRPSGARHGYRAALEEVLRSRALQKLPDVVLGQRSSADHSAAPPDHAGRDLVLLWDDPYRVPYEPELHPPAQDGAAL